MNQPEPISGRTTPHEPPLPDDFRHHMTFWAQPDIARDVVIVAECIPCDNWRRQLDGGHDLSDLIRLYAMHAGLEAAKELCIATLAIYGAQHITFVPATLEAVAAAVAENEAVLDARQCAICGATGGPMDPVYDSAIPGQVKWACNDLHACADRLLPETAATP